MKDEALRLAKELEGVIADVENGDGFDDVCLDTVKYVRDCLVNSKQALEQPEPEPVAWLYESVCGNDFATRCEPPSYAKNIRPLYTFPPKREWQGLTDDEICPWFQENTALTNEAAMRITRAIEAKLKEKNT